MQRSPLYRPILLLTLTLLLAAPAAEAGQSFRGGASAGLVEDLFARVWSFLSSAWNKNGCGLDPNGRCLAGKSAPLPSDGGCDIDPNGRCLAAQSVPVPTENGCSIDPNGICLP